MVHVVGKSFLLMLQEIIIHKYTPVKLDVGYSSTNASALHLRVSITVSMAIQFVFAIAVDIPIIYFKYVGLLLLAAAEKAVLASPKVAMTNEVTIFGEILASIRTDAWIDVNITGNQANASTCINDVATVWQSAATGNKWALHMLDAEAKFQSGILLGNLRNLGMYEQCVEIAARHNPTDIQSQYCMVSLSIPPDMFSDASSILLTTKISTLGQWIGSALSLTSAMCLPSSCSERDIAVIVNDIIKRKTESNKSKIEVAQVTCSRRTEGRFTLGEILITVLFAVAVSFQLYCTIVDFVNRRKGCGSSPALKTLAKFSLYTNAKSMLSTEITRDTIPALNGLRILSTIYLITIHRFITTTVSPIVDLASLLEWQYNWEATIAFMITFVVDIFLIMSGFLATRKILQSKRSGKEFSLAKNCITRYVRLTPSAVFMISVTIFSIHRLGSGPLWGLVTGYMTECCQKSWWTNILYVQNIASIESLCLPHLWYLAAEMQLFVATQIVLYALFRWPKYQKKIFGLVIVGSLTVPPVLFAINGYTNAYFRITLEMDIARYRDNFVYGYMSSIQRSFAYLVGAVLGFLTVNNEKQVTKLQAKIYWAIACSLMAICFLATQYLYLESYRYDVVFEVVYSALARPAWAFALAWVIYACMHGHGGPLAEFLSLPLFLPLSRISYCIYLVHFMLQSLMGVGVQIPIFYSKFAILHQVWGDLLVSTALGFLLSLFVETPMRILEGILKTSSVSQASLAQKFPEIKLEKNTNKTTKKNE